jgi:hypothetical protein
MFILLHFLNKAFQSFISVSNRLECFYANPVTDEAVILSGMAKTARFTGR